MVKTVIEDAAPDVAEIVVATLQQRGDDLKTSIASLVGATTAASTNLAAGKKKHDKGKKKGKKS